jgi:hypothetical protein
MVLDMAAMDLDLVAMDLDQAAMGLNLAAMDLDLAAMDLDPVAMDQARQLETEVSMAPEQAAHLDNPVGEQDPYSLKLSGMKSVG